MGRTRKFDPERTIFRQAELSVAETLRALGHADAIATSSTRDGGVDVVGSRIVAQVKWQIAPVGRPAVQSFVGSCQQFTEHDRAFFTQSGFTSEAIEYARVNKVALFVYELYPNPGKWTAFAGSLNLLARFPHPARHEAGKEEFTLIDWSDATHHKLSNGHAAVLLTRLRVYPHFAREWSTSQHSGGNDFLTISCRRTGHKSECVEATVRNLSTKRRYILTQALRKLPKIEGLLMQTRYGDMKQITSADFNFVDTPVIVENFLVFNPEIMFEFESSVPE